MSKLKAILATVLLFPASAWAADTLTINVSQSGSNVDVSLAGAIDTAAGTDQGGADWGGFLDRNFNISVGPSALVENYDVSFTGSSYAGGPASSVSDSTDSGDTVALLYGSGFEVPVGYTSGSALAGSSVFDGQTIAGLGLTGGTYEYDYGSGDKVILDIAGGVPEPATWSVLLLGMGLVGAVARSRRGERVATA